MTAIALRRLTIRRPDVSLRALRVWQRNRDVYLRLWKSELVWPLAEPIITLLALGIGLGGLVELPTGERYIEFIAPGLLAVFAMWAASAECAGHTPYGADVTGASGRSGGAASGGSRTAQPAPVGCVARLRTCQVSMITAPTPPGARRQSARR